MQVVDIWRGQQTWRHLSAACPGYYRSHRPINRTRRMISPAVDRMHYQMSPVRLLLPFPSPCLFASSTTESTSIPDKQTKRGNKKFSSVDTSAWAQGGRVPGQVVELPLVTTNTTGVCSFDIVKDCDLRKPFWALRFAIDSLVTFIWLAWLSYLVYSINTNRYRW